MATKRERQRLGEALCEYFIERGSIPSGREFMRDRTRPGHLSRHNFKKQFNNWGVMLDYLWKEFPDVMESLEAPVRRSDPKSDFTEGKKSALEALAQLKQERSDAYKEHLKEQSEEHERRTAVKDETEEDETEEDETEEDEFAETEDDKENLI